MVQVAEHRRPSAAVAGTSKLGQENLQLVPSKVGRLESQQPGWQLPPLLVHTPLAQLYLGGSGSCIGTEPGTHTAVQLPPSSVEKGHAVVQGWMFGTTGSWSARHGLVHLPSPTTDQLPLRHETTGEEGCGVQPLAQAAVQLSPS